MSGPKTSEYFLTPEQRAELERQREIQRRKMVAVETIQRCTNKVMAIQGDFAEEVAIARELIDSGDISRIMLITTSIPMNLKKFKINLWP